MRRESVAFLAEWVKWGEERGCPVSSVSQAPFGAYSCIILFKVQYFADYNCRQSENLFHFELQIEKTSSS